MCVCVCDCVGVQLVCVCVCVTVWVCNSTNSGTAADRQRLRELVYAPLVFLSDIQLFNEWQVLSLLALLVQKYKC